MSFEKLRVIVIGLDGATFDLILPWVREGHLPAFKRIIEEGAWGELQSTMPPLTGPAWSSFITGKNPGKHGIFDFMIRNPKGYNGVMINATYRTGPSFWNLLGTQGRKVIVFNVPVTYPPERLNGAMVSGFLTPPGSEDFIFPAELKERMDKEVGPFMPHYPGAIYALGREEKFVREIELMTDGTIRAMDFLMEREPWDLFFGVIQSPDLLQHCLWRFEDKKDPLYKENPRLSGAFLQNYQKIDDHLGKILESLHDQTILFVVSDHGFGHMEKQFFVNNWLLDEGFLVLKKTAKTYWKRVLFKTGFVPMRVHQFLAFLGMDLSKPIARNRERMFAGLNRWVLSLDDVDWKCSKAYAMGNMGFINVNLKGREPQGIIDPGRDYERALDEISERLASLKDSRTGVPLVDRILRGKELYWGPRTSSAPDLFLVMKNYAYHCRGDYIFVVNRAIEDPWLLFGSHRPNGILLCWGPGVKQGYRITGANIMDIGPTILGLMGGLIPEDMDGKFLDDLLTEEKRRGIILNYAASSTQIQEGTALSEEEQESVRKKLKSLGYLA